MSYTYPRDPRKPWEWCPKCEAWYEVDADAYYRARLASPGDCVHDTNEHRLTAEEIAAASLPASEIAKGMLLAPGTMDALRTFRDMLDGDAS